MASKKTKIAQAEAWWDDLTESERDQYRTSFKTGYSPTDAELISAFEVSGRADTVEPPLGEGGAEGGVPEVEPYPPGEEPPTVQPATPYASANNPDLMANDPPEGTPLYDRPTLPVDPTIKPTDIAAVSVRGEPADDHQTKMREIEAKETERKQAVADLKAKQVDEKSLAFKEEEAKRRKRQAESTEYVS